MSEFDNKNTFEIEHKILTRGDAEFTAMNHMSASYGQLGIRSSFVLNGGGLFAMPAFFAAILQKSEILMVMDSIVLSGGVFILGIFCAALSCGVAYVNYQLAGDGALLGANSELYGFWKRNGNKGNFDLRDFYAKKQEYNDLKAKNFMKWAKYTARGGLLLAIMSYLFFIGGAVAAGYTLLSIADH
ncbi:MAG: hypothetical protein AAGE61_00855 [Pseudomonadota bacterium]